jgi:hypothetical protein
MAGAPTNFQFTNTLGTPQRRDVLVSCGYGCVAG